MQKKILIFSEPFAKNLWLKKQNENRHFENVSFKNGWLPLSKVKANYPFFVDKKYGIHPDLSKRFLPYFDYIELSQNYADPKINKLKEIKRVLMEESILKAGNFDQYKVVQLDNGFVPNGIEIDEKLRVINPVNQPIDVYKTANTEDQVYAVYERIVGLLEAGVDINQIKVINSTVDDDFQLSKLCDDARIPLWINKARPLKMYPIFQQLKASLLKEGVEAAKTLVDRMDYPGYLKLPLIHLFNRYQDSLIESSLSVFISELEQVRIKTKRIKNAVEIMSIDQIVDLNHHHILMNYIDEIFPAKAIDNAYLSNTQKTLINYPSTDMVNQYRLEYYQHLLNGLSHLTLVYPARLVDETRMSHCQLSRTVNYIDYQYQAKKISYLPSFDLLRYGNLTYLYENYQMMSADYPLLKATFKYIEGFNHQFKGIYKDDLDQLLKERYTLTGTKIEALNLCPFKYFLTYLLNLDQVEANHYIYFGNQIHHALENLIADPNFDYVDMVYHSQGFPEDIAYKKPLYQKILIENIAKIYEIVKDFHDQSAYKEIYTEKYIERMMHPGDRFIIKGFIDKVMVDRATGYYAIVDYKYSQKTFSIKEFERGLKLQLLFYLYLFDEETNLSPSGVFFRQTGMNKEKSQENIDMKMQGVFLDHSKQMKRLDPNQNHIKGLAFKNDGDLKKSQSKLTMDEFNNMHDQMGQMIIKAAKKIEAGDFKIQPLLTIQANHSSISCQYCPFGHICYSKNKHIKEDTHELYDLTK